MRGRPGCPTGQKKNLVEATAGRAPFFYKERLGTKSPPHPTQCAHWGTFPPRGRLWRDEPDLGTFFRKNAFQHISPRKCVPNRSWHTGSNSPTTVPKPTIPKTSEWERAAIKMGSRGLPLVFFPPTFSKESRAPPPESAGPPGRCAPKAASERPTRRVRTSPPRLRAQDKKDAPGCGASLG